MMQQDLSSNRIVENLLERQLGSTLSSLIRDLERLPPDGKTTHKRTTAIGLLRTFLERFEGLGIEGQSFKQLRTDDSNSFRGVTQTICDAVSVGARF